MRQSDQLKPSPAVDASAPLDVAPGTVYLVGAGPGDPKLLTLAGKEALERADVVVFDRLVNPRLLALAPLRAVRIDAGKQAANHTLTQDEINRILARHALRGMCVVRLKGGDPFVFGRGAEEAQYLREHGVSFVVVPGISSAIAAPAYAGIPVTHRDVSSSFAVITGHERSGVRESGERLPGAAEQRRRWDRIAHAADTLVFLMAVESIDEIASQLIRNGRDASTPVAMVRWGTWAGRQETLTGTLADIAELVRTSGFGAPAVTVVGDVVRWRDTLRWWDSRPLSGRRIVVTRAREQASDMVRLLEESGAEAIEFPTIRLRAPIDGYAALDSLLGAKWDWLILASSNAVDAVFERLRAAGRDARDLAGCRIAAIGVATSARLADNGIVADFCPATATGESLAGELPGDIAGLRIAIARAALADETLPNLLRARGATVLSATAYETEIDAKGAGALRARLSDGTIDAVAFTSSSTVRNFATAIGADCDAAGSVIVAAIGPSTAKTAEEIFGRVPDIVAERHTVAALVEAIAAHYAGR